MPFRAHRDRDDAAAARAAAGRTFARYAGLENYQQVLRREGASDPSELAAVGNESAVERQLRAYADAGVTELWPLPFPVDAGGEDSLARTGRLLARLAAG